jgi:hypothetical protein
MKTPHVLGLFALSAFTANAADCDRACLKNVMTTYLNALVAQDPSKAPLAAKVRFTEDSKELKVGEGFWKQATKLGDYRQDFIDTQEQVVASHVLVEESGKPAFYTAVLRVDNDRKIKEIETLVTHPTDRMGPRGDFSRRPGMELEVPNAKKNKRADLIRIADFYPRGLTVGSFDKIDTPFVPGAFRIENGFVMAGEGCGRATPSGRPVTATPAAPAAGQAPAAATPTARAPQDVAGCLNIKTQRIIEHPALTKSIVAVDEEQGTVLLWMNFGDTGSYGEGNALVVYEAFKVYDNQMHAVQAFMKVLPKDTGRGWGKTVKGLEGY